MKKYLCAILLAVFLFTAGSVIADPETVTWTNPTTLTDGSAISSADQALIKTHIFWGTAANGPWTEFAVVSGGAATWTGVLPAPRGVQAYYTLTSELNSLQSAYLTPAVAYTRPFIACNPASNLVIKSP